MKALASAAFALALLGVAPGAQAVEHEHHFGIDVGGNVLVIGNKSTNDVGGTVMVHYAYGLSDAFNLMAEGTYSIVALGQTADGPHTPQTYPASIGNASVGLGYVFDVLTWVPYAGVLVGGYTLSGGTLPKMKFLPGAEIAAGLDYRIGSSIAIGVAVRQHLLSETDTYPSFTQVLLRFEAAWGR
jgi:hypothetical protein